MTWLRAALDRVGDAIDPGRQEAPERLREDDVDQALAKGQSDRHRRLGLPPWNGADRTPEIFDDLRRLEQGQRQHCGPEGRQMKPDGRQAVIDKEDEHQDRDAADGVAEDAHGPLQRYGAIDEADAHDHAGDQGEHHDQQGHPQCQGKALGEERQGIGDLGEHVSAPP
jgi:hypothetical protein